MLKTVIILLLLVPSYIDATDSIKNETPSEYEILVLQWIDKNALPDITILTPLEKGHIVSGIGGKRTVIDESFLLAPDSSQRYRDVQTIYSTKSEVEALELIYKYNVDYILIPVETELKYGKVKWLDDKGCFEEIFIGDPKLYKIIC